MAQLLVVQTVDIADEVYRLLLGLCDVTCVEVSDVMGLAVTAAIDEFDAQTVTQEIELLTTGHGHPSNLSVDREILKEIIGLYQPVLQERVARAMPIPITYREVIYRGLSNGDAVLQLL